MTEHEKELAGIILVLLSIVLLVFVIQGVKVNLLQAGPAKGSIRGNVPPYDGHEPVMVLGGIAAAAVFLGGIFLMGQAQMCK